MLFILDIKTLYDMKKTITGFAFFALIITQSFANMTSHLEGRLRRTFP